MVDIKHENDSIEPLQNDKKQEELPESLNRAIDRLILYTKIVGPQLTVTQMAKQVKQSRGGYIKKIDFEQITLELGEKELNEYENIHASLIGTAVDYLIRY